MNELLTVYALDDGYFPISHRDKTYTILVIVKTILNYNKRIVVFDDMRIEKIRVDSMDISSKMKKLITSYKPSPKDIVLLDGITYAGFGVVNLRDLMEVINNIIVFFYRPLDLHKVKRALMANFPDWYERYRIISEVYNKTATIEVNNMTIHVYTTLNLRRTRTIIRRTILFSPIPEPLRIAHIVASTLSRKALYP